MARKNARAHRPHYRRARRKPKAITRNRKVRRHQFALPEEEDDD